MEICARGNLCKWTEHVKRKGKKEQLPICASPSSRVRLNVLVDSKQDYQRD